MVSIYDIAEAVGVSPSTVSRALRGKGYCSEEKRQLVLKKAEEMGYSPTLAAKTLKSNRTQKILFCIPDIYNPFYFRMIKGATDVFEQNGYFPVLCHTKGQIELELKMIQNLNERYGDGMILVSFHFTEQNIQAVNHCEMPIVLTNRYESENPIYDRFDYVYIDTFEGIRMATQYLAQLGHRRLAYIGGKSETQTGRERLAEYMQGMKDSGIDLNPSLIKSGDYTSDSGEKAAYELLMSEPKPTGMVCANDLMAFGALKACHRVGLKVPDDMSVIGMDNTETATWSNPPLTSIIMKEEEIGHHAATFLMERIMHNRVKRKTMRLTPDICIRDSCAKPKTI